MMNNHQKIDINAYFVRWQDGRLTPSERHILDEWLQEDANKKAWDALAGVWRIAEEPAVPQGTPVEAQWLHLANRLPREQATHSTSLAGSIFGRLPNLPAVPNFKGATLTLGAIAFCVLLYTLLSPPRIEEAMVAFGQQLEVHLPDGSEVHLNSGSTFRYPEKFNDKVRLVELSGEGYFKVEPGQIPFVVETEFASTRVLGTEFNVRTWDSATEVFVSSGKVAVHSNIAVQASEVEVLPGQLAVCKDGPIAVQPTMNPGGLLSWRQGRLVFTNAPIPRVLKDIQRMFNVSIHVDSRLSAHSITAEFDRESVEQVVQTLAASLNATIVPISGGYELKARE